MGDEDARLQALTELLNELPELHVSGSTHGRSSWAEARRRNMGDDIPPDFFRVSISPEKHRICEAGYISIEFLAWAIYKSGILIDYPGIELRLHAAAPNLNGPGECLTFILEGELADPDKFALELRRIRDQAFVLYVPDGPSQSPQ